jgi:hypothetical protein
MVLRSLTAALLLLAVSSSASAMTLKDLQPGTYVTGPNLKVDEMKGKVVIVMYWGTH